MMEGVLESAEGSGELPLTTLATTALAPYIPCTTPILPHAHRTTNNEEGSAQISRGACFFSSPLPPRSSRGCFAPFQTASLNAMLVQPCPPPPTGKGRPRHPQAVRPPHPRHPPHLPLPHPVPPL
jgi:hypothetical protein